MANGTPIHRQKHPYKIHLKNHMCPGDVMVLTAAVESIKKQFPTYQISVDTCYPEIWENNPCVCDIPAYLCHIIDIPFPGVQGDNKCHFMQCFIQYIVNHSGIPLKLQVDKPSLYLSEAEKNSPLLTLDKPYLVINAGYKSDHMTKFAGTRNYQDVVTAFKDKVHFVQVGAERDTHPRLTGAIDMVGKTTLRELIRLCYFSAGGVGGITFLMHAMAALDRPYLAYLGGREPEEFLRYPKQVALSAAGMVHCAKVGGCWKSPVVPTGGPNDHRVCELPSFDGCGIVARCMREIGSAPAIAAIRGWFDSGVVPLPVASVSVPSSSSSSVPSVSVPSRRTKTRQKTR